jgi:hypothetical protein
MTPADLTVELDPTPMAASDSGDRSGSSVPPCGTTRPTMNPILSKWYRDELRHHTNETFLLLAAMEAGTWTTSEGLTKYSSGNAEWYAAATGVFRARAKFLCEAAAKVLNDLDGVWDVEGPE